MEIDILSVHTRISSWPFVGFYESRDISIMLADQFNYQLQKWIYIHADEDNSSIQRVNLRALQEMEAQLFQDCICDLIQYNHIRPFDIKQIQDIDKYK